MSAVAAALLPSRRSILLEFVPSYNLSFHGVRSSPSRGALAPKGTHPPSPYMCVHLLIAPLCLIIKQVRCWTFAAAATWPPAAANVTVTAAGFCTGHALLVLPIPLPLALPL